MKAVEAYFIAGHLREQITEVGAGTEEMMRDFWEAVMSALALSVKSELAGSGEERKK